MITILDDTGRLELPDFIQAQLGVKPGDVLARRLTGRKIGSQRPRPKFVDKHAESGIRYRA